MVCGKHKKAAGFTLVELLLVMLIGVALATIAAPALIRPDNIKTAAEAVADDIAMARILAMRIGRPVEVRLTPGSGDYLLDGKSRSIAGFGSGFYMVSGGPIIFNTLGEPKRLSAPMTITVSDGGSFKDIVIQPYTGLVTMPGSVQ